MPLTDELLAELRDRLYNPRSYSDQPGQSPYWHDGFGMNYILQRTYRLGLLRAAIICERIDREDDTGYAVVGECAQAIRAEAEKC